ncbi:hypothetical protein Pla123a_22520 [Posidoniimonas polymericola]|uniref:Glutaminase A n=1 Tax=Posidoniimonas polymericola TaxID=2528002 RepID=A0A5C5YPS7_9BACT|nr:glutaminase family protein [Posidoniimonas polymericola]TWT76829.1 hypothetical protein Pla123a_22520 [Posidoniimonas polymericola]
MRNSILPLTKSAVIAAAALACHAAQAVPHESAPPATPLIACDPYFSVWSPGPELAAANTEHWTGKPHRLASIVTVDNKRFRVMGADPAGVAAMPQTGLEVSPTQTRYTFAGAGVEVELKFTTPSLPEDIDLLSRPITYLTYTVHSTDGAEHDVAIDFVASSELSVNNSPEEATASTTEENSLAVAAMSAVNQRVLRSRGDDIRIDWGTFYVAAKADQADVQVGKRSELMNDRDGGGETQAPARSLAGRVSFHLDAVGAEPQSRWLIAAYDDLYSIQFMHQNLRPYWRRNGLDASGLLAEAATDYARLLKRCDAFDEELTADLRAAGGDDYAYIGSLAFRQCFAAGKFVADANGQPIQFCKENHSNGCIGTSDVFYPMAPQFLLFGPTLAKSFIAPFMEYAASDRWTFPFAPHDLGTYPKANGQVYGGGETSEENQMPVEESGNMLILMAAVAQLEGNTSFADRYWPELTQWAEYLREEGFDPDNQLCTDDFAGHLAHNVNLSAKAICGLGSYAKLCEMRGDAPTASEYRKVAEEFAARWVEAADDGDHFRLTFDRPGTWSQKYNLVWDKVLGLNLFPEAVLAKEMAYYKQAQNEFGLPLDNRNTYTKLDWVLWTASLTNNREDFAALVAPVVKFLDETPNRQPMTDWYKTDTARKVGFTARPVVGGVFMRMLYDDKVVEKWASREKVDAGDYAPLPIPPVVTEVVPTAADRGKQAPEWQYTFDRPRRGWFKPGFNASSWKTGAAGFGSRGTPNARNNTNWTGGAIWIRREFDVDASKLKNLQLYVHYDEDARVYINGELAARLDGYSTDYELVPISPAAIATLKPTGNTLAVSCRNQNGGQYIDVGFATVEKAGDSVASKE